jgi:SAM-dependent methyltransferase
MSDTLGDVSAGNGRQFGPSSGLGESGMDRDERRLWALEALYDPLTIVVLGQVGLSPHWRCLEIGAGRGSIARWLSTQCLYGSVTATDTDLRYLADLQAPNLRVRQHDIVDGPDLPRASFDLVHARAVLVHLPDRQAVLHRAVTWLAPGGWLLAEEPALFPIDSCLDPNLRLAVTGFERLLANRLGSDFRWPRQLSAALRAAGLVDVKTTATLTMTGNTAAINEFWRINLTELGPDLVESGLISRTALGKALTVLDDPDHNDLTLALVCAWGRRPDKRRDKPPSKVGRRNDMGPPRATRQHGELVLDLAQ